jgi:hypothetical protein
MRRKFKFNELKKLHAQIGALIEESDDNLAAAGNSDADDGVLNLAGPDTPVISPDDEDQTGAMDARSRRGKSMGEAFPGFNRIPNFK